MVDNQSQNRLETLCSAIQSTGYNKNDREKIVSDVFSDMIQAQKNSQDAQTLQIIKEFYSRELAKRTEEMTKSISQQVTQAIDRERMKRVEAEQRMHQMYEEMKKQQAQLVK